MSKVHTLVRLPRCGGSDGIPRARAHDRGADDTFRACRNVATHRIEWSTATATAAGATTVGTHVGAGYVWQLHHREELACDRHLPVLLEYADRDVAFARSPYRHYRTRVEVANPALIRLEFVLNKRAASHGRTEYMPIETPLTGPVAFTLF